MQLPAAVLSFFFEVFLAVRVHLSDDLSRVWMAVVYIALQIADSRSTDIQAKGPNECNVLPVIY